MDFLFTKDNENNDCPTSRPLKTICKTYKRVSVAKTGNTAKGDVTGDIKHETYNEIDVKETKNLILESTKSSIKIS